MGASLLHMILLRTMLLNIQRANTRLHLIIYLQTNKQIEERLTFDSESPNLKQNTQSKSFSYWSWNLREKTPARLPDVKRLNTAAIQCVCSRRDVRNLTAAWANPNSSLPDV